MRPDDCSLTPQQQLKIRKEAERALARAGALGRFPTPVEDVMAVADLEEVDKQELTTGFIASLRMKTSGLIKQALGKIIGLFDARSKLVFIDQTLHLVKKRFVRLHETAHSFLPWQRDIYAVVEDSQETLEHETADLFDREANSFASDVLFQVDAFTNDAAEIPFGILVPVKLSKKYGSSIYAAVRRYVSHNARACAVIVLNPPEFQEGEGFRCGVRRVICSPLFDELFGSVGWPDCVTPGDRFGAMVPIGRKMSGKRLMPFIDGNGDRRECIAEAFTQKHQIFILLHAVDTLAPMPVLMVRAR